MRSWMAFVMPITLTGLQALSVEMPTTVSTGQPVLLDRADDVLGALDVGLDRFPGEVLAGGHLLQRRRIDDDVGVAQGRGDAVEVAHVADAELEQPFEVVIDDFVRRGLAVLILQPHVVLLGLVAREDDDLVRHAQFAGEEPPDEHLAERAGAAGDENALVIEDPHQKPTHAR